MFDPNPDLVTTFRFSSLVWPWFDPSVGCFYRSSLNPRGMSCIFRCVCACVCACVCVCVCVQLSIYSSKQCVSGNVHLRCVVPADILLSLRRTPAQSAAVSSRTSSSRTSCRSTCASSSCTQEVTSNSFKPTTVPGAEV